MPRFTTRDGLGSDVITALAALEQVLQELGHPVDLGAGVRAAQKILGER